MQAPITRGLEDRGKESGFYSECLEKLLDCIEQEHGLILF